MLYRVTYEDVAFTGMGEENDPIELELDENFLIGYSQTRRAERTFPAQVLAVLKATATPDDEGGNGRRDDGVKLFVSIDLLIDAEDEYDLPDGEKLLGLLTHVSDQLSTEIHLERNFEILEHDDFEVGGHQWLESLVALEGYAMDPAAPAFPDGDSPAAAEVAAALDGSVVVFARSIGEGAGTWRLTKAGELISEPAGDTARAVPREEALAHLSKLMEAPVHELLAYQFEHAASAPRP